METNLETNRQPSDPKSDTKRKSDPPSSGQPRLNGDTLGAELGLSANEAFLKAPDIYRYQDYRKYLKDWLEWKKRLQPAYSGALFSRMAGFSSQPLLGMVIRGERNLSYETVRLFAKALGLKTREKIYFEKLVFFCQARTSEDRSEFFEELVSLSQGSGKKLLTEIQDYARYLSHWYIAVIRELTALPDFKPTPEWISKKLKRKVSKAEAEQAWNLLLDLGFVKENKESGRFEMTHPAMDFDPGTVDFAVRHFHKEFLGRIRDAIDEEGLRERELSALTLALSNEDLDSLRAKVKEFRKQINLIYSGKLEKVKPAHVVSMNMQMLVLTDSQTDSPSVGNPMESKKAVNNQKSNQEREL